MTINGLDYSKRYAQDRDYFNETSKKVQETADKRVEDSQKKSDYVISKQRDNFLKDRTKLEKNYQENISDLKERTETSIDQTKEKFNKTLQKERQEFTQDSINKSRDFGKKLEDIKSSYKKAFESETDRNETISKSNKLKYEKNIQDNKKTFDKKLKEYDDKISGASADVRAKNDQERLQLVSAQEDRLNSAYKDAAKSVADIKEKNTVENKKLRENHNQEISAKKELAESQKMELEKKVQRQLADINIDYALKNEELEKSNSKYIKNVNSDYQKRIADLKAAHRNEVSNKEFENNKKMWLEETNSDEVSLKQQGLKKTTRLEKQVKDLNKHMVDMEKSLQSRIEVDNDKFKEELSKQSFELNKAFEKQFETANKDKVLTVSREREKFEKDIRGREEQKKLDQVAFDSQIQLERSSANEKIARLKENFNNSMKMLEERHKLNLEEISKEKSQDKSKIITSFNERRLEEMSDIKRSFTKMLDSTVQEYEQRLASIMRDNEYIKNNLNQKIQTILDQTEKQLESQRVLFENQRVSDRKSQQTLMDERENQLKRTFSTMNLNFQKKIDRLQIESEARIKLLTNDYESKLREVKATMAKELGQKDTLRMEEISKIKEANESEKARIVSMYETQIEAMKGSHKEQLNQMAEFKRLS